MQQYTHENVRSIPHLPIYCDRYEDYRQFHRGTGMII